MESEAFRDIYFDADLEELIIKSRERSLFIYLEQELLRKISTDWDFDIFIYFLHANDKQNFIILLKRYFDFIKKEKIYDEYLLLTLEKCVIIKKEAFSKIKKPILKISDFFDKKERILISHEKISEVVEIKFFHDGKISKVSFLSNENKEDEENKNLIKNNSQKIIKNSENKNDSLKLIPKDSQNDIISKESDYSKDSFANEESMHRSKIRGRGNFMWISQTEIEDEDCLEMLSKLNLNRQIQDEKLENNSITKEKENTKEKGLNKQNKENILNERNSLLTKACEVNISLQNNKNYAKFKNKFNHDESFDYFVKNPFIEDSKLKKFNKNSETVLPKVDHIFCISDIILNANNDLINNEFNQGELNLKTENNKFSCLKTIYAKLNNLTLNKDTNSDNKTNKLLNEAFDDKNIIELQTNKIYIIIADDKKHCEYLINELNKNLQEEFKQFKISLLANSPEKIKKCVCTIGGKKIPKPNVAVINRMITSHLKSNSFKKNN